jgi:hypothetical protein
MELTCQQKICLLLGTPFKQKKGLEEIDHLEVGTYYHAN